MLGFLGLIELSEIDLQIASIETEIETSDDGSDLDKEVNDLMAKKAHLDGLVKKLKSELDDLKLFADKASTEKKKMDSQLFSAGVQPKTISEIQKRLGDLAKHVDELETKELEIMDKFDENNKLLDRLNKYISLKKEVLDKSVSEYKKLTVKGEIKLEELKRKRDELEPNIEPELTKMYNKIVISKGGMGMAEIIGNLCNGCHQTISMALLEQLRIEPEQIHYCNNCGRIVWMRGSEK